MMPAAMKTKTKTKTAVDSGEKENKYKLENINHLFSKIDLRLTIVIEYLGSNLN